MRIIFQIILISSVISTRKGPIIFLYNILVTVFFGSRSSIFYTLWKNAAKIHNSEKSRHKENPPLTLRMRFIKVTHGSWESMRWILCKKHYWTNVLFQSRMFCLEKCLIFEIFILCDLFFEIKLSFFADSEAV